MNNFLYKYRIICYDKSHGKKGEWQKSDNQNNLWFFYGISG